MIEVTMAAINNCARLLGPVFELVGHRWSKIEAKLSLRKEKFLAVTV